MIAPSCVSLPRYRSVYLSSVFLSLLLVRLRITHCISPCSRFHVRSFSCSVFPDSGFYVSCSKFLVPGFCSFVLFCSYTQFRFCSVYLLPFSAFCLDSVSTVNKVHWQSSRQWSVSALGSSLTTPQSAAAAVTTIHYIFLENLIRRTQL